MQRAASPRPGPGSRVGGYELVREISATPSAQVFEARSAAGEPVAVKLLGDEAAADHRAARFHHEIDVLRRTCSLNVIDLLDHGVIDGRSYLVTPFIQGRTLRELLSARPVCPEVALLLLAELAAGAAALHRAGLVHRDLKPENVMITGEGRVLIIDLGLATAPEHTRYTEEGAVVGSVPYMSPEQIEGAEVTAASDVWSLAVMAYEWMAGQRPFQRARQSEEVAAILACRYQPLLDRDRRASPALGALLADCLELDPARRPRDAGALAQRLAPLIDWLHGGTTEPELRAIAIAPYEYDGRVRSKRVADAMAAAQAALDAGDAFAATRELDRGLAYAPNDPGLRALVEIALSRPVAVTPIRTKRRWSWPIGAAAAALAMSVVAIAIAASTGDASGPAPAEATAAPATETPATEAPATEAPPPVLAPPPAQPAAAPPPGRLTTPAVRIVEPAPAPASDRAPAAADPFGPWQSADIIFVPPL
ncbi:MAG TPA: serine/threonine-protein kinase [Kofleriaceae bacterium]|nr:serine/threonine-protein kinase [Kofleriaceae bacterium]